MFLDLSDVIITSQRKVRSVDQSSLFGSSLIPLRLIPLGVSDSQDILALKAVLRQVLENILSFVSDAVESNAQITFCMERIARWCCCLHSGAQRRQRRYSRCLLPL